MSRVNHNGYIETFNRTHHRSRGNGYVFEHILVAEEKFGFPITRDMDVHHIDGDRQNNHPDNLEVMTKSDHAKETQRARKEKSMKPCEVCGKVVYKRPSHIKKSKHGKSFCSLSCVGTWSYQNKKGVFTNVK